ncbi:MAG: hypothetical protein F4X98_09600 [Gammaproteobacteria bacterium]|nr:hypothetical protein [Gammaproteobacteria bacterium]
MQADAIFAGFRLLECGRERFRAAALVLAGACCTLPVIAGGYVYETPFTEPVRFDDVLLGEFPESFPKRDIHTLVAYIHLTGQFTEEHANLFRPRDRETVNRVNYQSEFWQAVGAEGYEPPPGFSPHRRESVVRTVELADGESYSYTNVLRVQNCMADAFKTAYETMLDRRARYGSGSVQLSRWIEAQIKVFAQCSGETEFDPPAEPAAAWPSLERHDRHYQIAASHFYNAQYLEAASRFRRIGETPDSPWRDLGRYLVARSLAREAIDNENDPERHLRLALEQYRELANEPDYLAAFPSVRGQISFIEARLRPVALREELERRLIEDPASLWAGDVGTYHYLLRQPEAPLDETSFRTWHRLATGGGDGQEVLERWREERSLEWLYLALERAQPGWDATTLTELLTSTAFAPDTPGYLNMLLHRIRITGILGDPDTGLRLAESALRIQPSKSHLNRIRTAAAGAASNWTDYFRWAPLTAISLRWSDDDARRLPANFNRITRDTPLFSKDTAALVNDYFTATMILEVLDTPELLPHLGPYLRGRLAIAGWTKAMLADEMATALELAQHIRIHVPLLDRELLAFQQAEDKHFEAARIVFDHPAFSPWIRAGEGRTQSISRPPRPMPDYIAGGTSGNNWWCAALNPVKPGEVPRIPRFSRYTEREKTAIRNVALMRETSASASFGPHVLRYAKENLDDPRVPRTLHRLVFATRHTCSWNAPGSISRGAFVLLHRHFPDSEWAEKTPHWYGEID